MKKPIYKRWWFIVLIVIVVICVAGAAGGGSSTDRTDSGNTASQEEKAGGDESTDADADQYEENLVDGFEIVGDFSTESDGYSYYITGKIINKKGKELDYAQIIFNLYDEEGAQIGTAIDNINGLKEDGVWKFEAMALEDPEKIASWELDSIDAF